MVARYRPKRNIERGRPSPEAAEKKPTGYVAFDGTTCRAKRVTTFTEQSAAKLKPPAEGQVEFFERLERGRTLVLRLSYGGTKAWRVVYYRSGRPRAKTLGKYPDLRVADARKSARSFDPDRAEASAEAGSFREVAELWLKRHVEKKGLHSRREIERQLEKYIYPDWERTPFFDIRRKTVTNLLDRIEDRHGASQADGVLATVRNICNWYQTRDDDYTSPIVRGMKRDPREAEERRRKRILSDDEIRAVWRAADKAGTYGAIVKLALLTGQRREKIATMRWQDIDGGDWDIQTEARRKGVGGRLRLVGAALDIVEAQPKIEGNPYVFAGSARGRRRTPIDRPDGPPAFNAWSKRKAELDQKMLDELEAIAEERAPRDDALLEQTRTARWLLEQNAALSRAAKSKDRQAAARAQERLAEVKAQLKAKWWTTHDLRRTARTLLERLDVKSTVAEHLIGHLVIGIKGVYNRYEYYEEKVDALARLERLLNAIVNPSPDQQNVVQMPTHARSQ